MDKTVPGSNGKTFSIPTFQRHFFSVAKAVD
jgi:hypothetical protein